MNKAVKFTIELEYDLASLRFMTDRQISEDDFLQEADEYATHDLMDLIRSNAVSDFAKVTEYTLD